MARPSVGALLGVSLMVLSKWVAMLPCGRRYICLTLSPGSPGTESQMFAVGSSQRWTPSSCCAFRTMPHPALLRVMEGKYAEIHFPRFWPSLPHAPQHTQPRSGTDKTFSDTPYPYSMHTYVRYDITCGPGCLPRHVCAHTQACSWEDSMHVGSLGRGRC